MDLERMARIGSRLSPVATDALIVGGLAVAGLLQAWPGHPPTVSDAAPGTLIAYLAPFALALAVALPLGLRRTYPLIVASIVAVGYAVSELAPVEMSSAPVALLVASYSVGRYASPRTASIAGLVAVVVTEAAVAIIVDGIGAWLVFLTTVTLALWSIGHAAQQHETRTVVLEERAARQEAERQAAVARAAEAERARIARDLHDVIAHDVTVMVVQAAAAGRILDRDPAEARRSLEAIETTGRLTLAEMRRVLGAVHRTDGRPPTEPPPSLAGLDRLVDEMRASGLAVDLTVAGLRRAVSPEVDLSAYRIVQEALTNALRHGGNGATHVSVAYTDLGIDIDVTNDRPPVGEVPRGPATTGGGRGLTGMRERVELVHGELEAGPQLGGGFRVRARLPLAGA